MNIQRHVENYMGGKGLHEEKLTLFGRPLFRIPKFFQALLFKHDIHHMITGFGTDLLGEAKLLCWEVGAGAPWWYFEKYAKFPVVFLFMPRLASEMYKQGKGQNCLYDVDDAALRSKSLEEVEHYIEFGKFPES